MGTVNAYEDDERELIDRAQSGEMIAFQRLAEQHAALLLRCALALGKDSHWAEDLVQETLVEAWRSLAVSMVVAGSPLGYTAFYGTGS